MSPRHRFLWLLKPHRLRLIGATCLATAACTLSLAVPLLIERVLSTAGQSGSLSTLLALAALLILIISAQAAAGSANAWLLGSLAIEIVRSLRRDLYRRVQQLPIAWFDRTPAGRIISRIMDDVGSIQSLAAGQTLVTLLEALTALAATAWLWSRSWKLGLVVAAIAPIYVAIFRFSTRRIRRGTLDVRQQLDQVFGHLKQKIDGIQVVRATAAEAAEVARFTHQIAALHQPRVEVSRQAICFTQLCLLIGGIGAALVFAVGAQEVQAGRLAVGELIAASVISGLIFAPMARLSELAAAYEHASASFQRLGEILDAPTAPPAVRLASTASAGAASGQISFRNVSFRYAPDRPLLRNVSFSIEPGSKVAIVGPTGSGKTTLMNLLLRFYEPTSGEITLGGQPLGEVADVALREIIGVVPQEPVIFRGTLAENIRYGAAQSDPAAVQAAARAALVDRIANRLPHGYDTLVGEGGHPLSQGERQLVSLARLFCKNPKIVVLDEATSALDPASEELIQAALSRLLTGRTTVVIAHRLATVLSADQILVMDQGDIVQKGTHEQLWADDDGLYRTLCDAQFAADNQLGHRLSARRAAPMLEPVSA